jgi:hypothetical protein
MVVFHGCESREANSCRQEKEQQHMNAIQGSVKNGAIVLDHPADLPEGTRVEVLPVGIPRPTLGMREEDWPTTPEGIAALLARMDEVERL